MASDATDSTIFTSAAQQFATDRSAFVGTDNVDTSHTSFINQFSTSAAMRRSDYVPPPDAITFSAADYVVFAISLAIPLLIGVFFFFWDLKKSTTQNFLMGERSINFVAVALSILASLINGIFVIGVPAEIHYYGTRMVLMVVGLFLVVVTVSHIYANKYQAMRFTSAYEYVEQRFNYATRVVASCIFCLSVIIFLAVVLYVPALSFAQGMSRYFAPPPSFLPSRAKTTFKCLIRFCPKFVIERKIFDCFSEQRLQYIKEILRAFEASIGQYSLSSSGMESDVPKALRIL